MSNNEKKPPSLIPGHAPHSEEIHYTIGPYQVLKSIATGGMGEVLLAYDTICGRRIALKKIREDLLQKKMMHDRFLNEAHITAQLTHPSIIPIYTIQDENNITYYTMPYVQGDTLKEILIRTYQQQRSGEKLDHIGGSIPALMRIFISICQAVAYAHSNKILHRDLKPENIIIGKYGEVLILDWGLAKLTYEEEEEESDLPESDPTHELTHAGKIVGTVPFMAPERALGHPASIQTDIYSLGVILYLMLTLRSPFQRSSLKAFRENMEYEEVPEPSEAAPYRDVPNILSNIAKKCLERARENRYQSVDALIRDLENYIEGRSEWFLNTEIDVKRKEDWEFQENVLIAEHIAITRAAEVSEWVNLMISHNSFTGNTKIEADITLGEKSHGIGFLMSIPEAAERVHINDGYCLWLGSDLNRTTKLLRSSLEVLTAPEIYLNRGKTYHLRLEKVENNLHFYLNNELQFSYISHLPLLGTHIGLLSRDADYHIENFKVYTASQSITISCLAVPDAFLAHKDYNTALAEYRRIGYSFPDRAEGRDALFRAGITLMDQARNTEDLKVKTSLFDQALLEFEKLHKTPAAPLEYLGKSLVYRTLNEFEEEAKCFELAYRRYPNHPLLPILHEQTIYRIHETSRKERRATYHFSLIASQNLPKTLIETNVQKLFHHLQNHWEPLEFIDETDPREEILFSLQLAFWLARPYTIEEIVDGLLQEDPLPVTTLSNAFWVLIELGEYEMVENKLNSIKKKNREFDLIRIALQAHHSLPKAVDKLNFKRLLFPEIRLLSYLMGYALDQRDFDSFEKLEAIAMNKKISKQWEIRLVKNSLWKMLLNKEWEEAGEIFHQYPLSILTDETKKLHFLYGCWLYVTEGKEIAEIHLGSVLDVPYPRTWLLANHYLTGKLRLSDWKQDAFLWEKKRLYRHLRLFYHCIGEQEKESECDEKLKSL